LLRTLLVGITRLGGDLAGSGWAEYAMNWSGHATKSQSEYMLSRMPLQKTGGETHHQLEAAKRAAAQAAMRYVHSGMTLGLGTGSTAHHFIELVAERVRSGELRIEAVASSEESGRLAALLGIRISAPARRRRVDLTVDGADEIAPDLNLIKGRGGALLREKVLAQNSEYFLVIADSSKRVEHLGGVALPVEVAPFATPWVTDTIEDLGGNPQLRMKADAPDEPFLTDQRNFILDCTFREMRDPVMLATRLDKIAGIAGHGLFLGLARAALVANGSDVNLLRPGEPPAPSAAFDRLP